MAIKVARWLDKICWAESNTVILLHQHMQIKAILCVKFGSNLGACKRHTGTGPLPFASELNNRHYWQGLWLQRQETLCKSNHQLTSMVVSWARHQWVRGGNKAPHKEITAPHPRGFYGLELVIGLCSSPVVLPASKYNYSTSMHLLEPQSSDPLKPFAKGLYLIFSCVTWAAKNKGKVNKHRLCCMEWLQGNYNVSVCMAIQFMHGNALLLHLSTCWFWYAVTAMNCVSGKMCVLNRSPIFCWTENVLSAFVFTMCILGWYLCIEFRISCRKWGRDLLKLQVPKVHIKIEPIIILCHYCPTVMTCLQSIWAQAWPLSF